MEKTERAKEMGETDRKRGIREEGRDEQQRVKYVDDDIEKKAPPSCQEPDSLARSLPPGAWRTSGPGERALSDCSNSLTSFLYNSLLPTVS